MRIYMALLSYSLLNKIYIDQIARKLKPLLTSRFRFRDCSAQGDKIVYFPEYEIVNCVNGTNKNLDIWAERIPLLNVKCKNCIAIGICGGGCIYDSKFFGNATGFDGRHCRIMREFIKEALWLFYNIDHEKANDKQYLLSKYSDVISYGPKQTVFSVGH